MATSLTLCLVCVISVVASRIVEVPLKLDISGVENSGDITVSVVVEQSENEVLAKEDEPKDQMTTSVYTTAAPAYPRDCVEARGRNTESGVVIIYPEDDAPLEVYCDQDTDGGGWLVFQRRQDGSVDFYRNYTSYQNGFGDVSGEFWLGLDALYTLTSSRTYELRVDLTMWNGTKGFATYSTFSISDSSNNYRLHIGEYDGISYVGDSLWYHNNTQFATFDRGYGMAQSCARQRHGAWWYKNCAWSNLNGLYKHSYTLGGDGVTWNTLDAWYPLKFTEMKMRPVLSNSAN